MRFKGRKRGRPTPTIAADPSLKKMVTEFIHDATVRGSPLTSIIRLPKTEFLFPENFYQGLTNRPEVVHSYKHEPVHRPGKHVS